MKTMSKEGLEATLTIGIANMEENIICSILGKHCGSSGGDPGFR